MNPPVDALALRDRYLAAQIAGDQRRALRVISEGLDAGLTIEALRADVVCAAQLEIGRLWQENRISVAHEHMATAISQMALAILFERAQLAPARGIKIMIACVEGEHHEFPARLVADQLEIAGYEVRYLGGDVPTESLVALVGSERPNLLALSVTMSFNAGGLRQAVAGVRSVQPALPILVGGHALDWAPSLAAQLGVATAGKTAAELLDAVARHTEEVAA